MKYTAALQLAGKAGCYHIGHGNGGTWRYHRKPGPCLAAAKKKADVYRRHGWHVVAVVLICETAEGRRVAEATA